jgi:hypothetical protein
MFERIICSFAVYFIKAAIEPRANIHADFQAFVQTLK